MSPKEYDQEGLLPAQTAIICLVAPGARVLEIGCATGYMTRVLKNTKGCSVTAVEIDELMAEKARAYADRMIVGDIADPGTWEGLGGDYDYVLYADVLEHLADPWEALRRTHSVLSATGCVIASLPNIAQYRIRLKLLLGRFDYRPYGILDDTHLRFFTAKTARDLFAETGYDVLDMLPANWRALERLMVRFAPRVFAVQFVFRAKPSRPDQRGVQDIA